MYMLSARVGNCVLTMDQRFGSEKAKMSFQKFQKYLVSNNEEARICALYRFNAVISQAVDWLADFCGVDHGPEATMYKTHLPIPV